MKTQWVPYPAVAERTEGRIRTGWSGMPTGFDEERLFVNTTALESGVIKWGGFASMKIGAYQGDEDQITYGVSGANADGSASASGAVSLQKAERLRMNPQSNPDLNVQNIRNGNLEVSWNAAALNSSLELDKRFYPVSRARQLNGIIKRGGIRGVVAHNVVDIYSSRTPVDKLGALGVDLLYPSNIYFLLEGYDASIVRSLLVGILVSRGVVHFNNSRVFGKDRAMFEPFLSGRYGHTAAAVGVLGTRTLVTAAK